jgi:aminoglycoside phosphotransferase (APT) family kinase protein
LIPGASADSICAPPTAAPIRLAVISTSGNSGILLEGSAGTLRSGMGATLAPDDVVRTHAEAASNAREPLLVLEPLLEYLDSRGLDAPTDLAATPIGEGHSNVTFSLSTGVVVRRPPRGPLPPSAHDVLREARLLRSLQDTPVRVPKVLAVCDDQDVIGAPFYVMELLEGEVITNALPEPLDNPTERARIADELIDSLVELHSVDWRAVGLDGFGKPTGYLERQLRRFNGLWEHNRTRELKEVEQVGEWLAANMPESPPATIVHGDYRLGNTMFAPGVPAKLIAIFDWEMATIGDPLADVGYMIMHWTQQGDPVAKFNLHAVTTLPGFPSREQLIARYEERSGRSIRALNWYVTLALWKAVVFMEGNYKRAVAGSTDDPYLKSFGDGVVEIAQRALSVSQHGL